VVVGKMKLWLSVPRLFFCVAQLIYSRRVSDFMNLWWHQVVHWNCLAKCTPRIRPRVKPLIAWE
jgi:hypothetical protein